MNLTTMPGCCKAVVVSDFGGGHAGEEGYCSQRPTILRWMIAEIKKRHADGYAVIFATPTSTQMPAVQALKDLGFYHNEDGCNIKYYDEHPDAKKHTIYPMYFCLNEYKKGMFDWLEEELSGKPKKKSANIFNAN